MASSSLEAGVSSDWPMSREEKKTQVLKLYSRDVQVADGMLRAGEESMQALKMELEAIRRASGLFAEPSSSSSSDCREAKSQRRRSDSSRSSPDESEVRNEVMRLRSAVESAAALLRAMEPADDASDDGESETVVRPRARSEGGARAVDNGTPLKPALSRTPRTSRCGTPLRVSFGDPDRPREVLSSSSDSEREQDDRRRDGRRRASGKSASTNPRRSLDDDLAQVGANDDAKKQTATSHCSPSRRLSLPEPEPERPEGQEWPGKAQQHGVARDSDLQGDDDEGAAIILPEMCAGPGVAKIGISFKHLPPEEMWVKKVNLGSWAAEQGIRAGDVVVAVNGRRTKWMKGPQFMEMMNKRPLRLLVERLTSE
eukprot:TRINITY_DN46735_c0_g1_i1.p1 TRINITY_DN46735_c0_g1~~TRINITY_DN46735_c0_g1_i1.p1  ORF type:complete len:370 (+),score=80.92 TRINITY_DN46735_c0_g1_i1:56-1165(+)